MFTLSLLFTFFPHVYICSRVEPLNDTEHYFGGKDSKRKGLGRMRSALSRKKSQQGSPEEYQMILFNDMLVMAPKCRCLVASLVAVSAGTGVAVCVSVKILSCSPHSPCSADLVVAGMCASPVALVKKQKDIEKMNEFNWPLNLLWVLEHPKPTLFVVVGPNRGFIVHCPDAAVYAKWHGELKRLASEAVSQSDPSCKRTFAPFAVLH
jgi:hypothetical protein